MRTYVYVDGFNLYYGSLKGKPYKWLDLMAFFRASLRPQNDILAIKYYIARVSARPDNPDGPMRQDTYLRALERHIPQLKITEGHFIQRGVTMLRENPSFGRKYVRVIRTDEKGSDVNLAVHLLNDAWHNRFDCAVVCSNDGDLSESLRIVKTERHKSIVLIAPGDPANRPISVELKRWTSKAMRVDPAKLAASLLPSTIPGTTIHKPKTW